MSTAKAAFGAGFVWVMEAAFAAIPGVTAIAVGYEGGALDRPTYKDVCTDKTGHTEVVNSTSTPKKSPTKSTRRLLLAPRTRHAQPPGTGLGRAVPLRHLLPLAGQERRRAPKRTIDRPRPLETQTRRHQVERAQTLWRAEDYRQRISKGGQADCHI